MAALLGPTQVRAQEPSTSGEEPDAPPSAPAEEGPAAQENEATPDDSPARDVHDDERARVHFEAASSHFHGGRYEDAAAEFRLAYELSGRATLLLNEATAHERARAFGAASDALLLYASLFEADSREAQSALARAERDRTHALDEAQREAELARSRIAPPTEAPAAPPARDAEAHDGRLLPLGWMTLGLGAGALGAALGTQRGAARRERELLRTCDADGRCPASARRQISSGRRLSRASVGLLAGGGAAALVGLVMVLRGATKDTEDIEDMEGPPAEGEGPVASGPALTLVPGPGDVGLALGGSF